MNLYLDLKENSYDIVIEPGVLGKADQYLRLDRKVLIVTDDGVPSAYAEGLAKLCREPFIMTVPQGEDSKSIRIWESDSSPEIYSTWRCWSMVSSGRTPWWRSAAV